MVPEFLGRQLGAVHRGGCQGEPHPCFLATADGPTGVGRHGNKGGGESLGVDRVFALGDLSKDFSADG